MVNFMDALRQIIDQLTGMDYSDLTRAERNILKIAARGLGKTVNVVNDKILLEKVEQAA
jgi:hypothetical protein